MCENVLDFCLIACLLKFFIKISILSVPSEQILNCTLFICMQPMSMVLPGVVGFKLLGRLRDGVTATDLVLTVTQMLRKHGVVGKFVEFYGKSNNLILLILYLICWQCHCFPVLLIYLRLEWVFTLLCRGRHE